MAAPIPTREPLEFVLSTSVSWRRELADFAADDGWSLTYYLDGPDEQTIAAAADGAGHLVELTPAETGAFSAGVYAWQALATDGTDVVPVGAGTLEVKPNQAAATLSAAEVEARRPFAERMLEAIEATLERRASKDQQSYTIEGRSLQRMRVEELERWRASYKRQVRKIRRAQACGVDVDELPRSIGVRLR